MRLVVTPAKNGTRSQHGFSLVEVLIGFFVFVLMCLMFSATFPVATHASHIGDDYSQASLLAQHKVDQLRDAGYSNLSGSSLASLGIIDSSTPAADGSYSFTVVDNLADRGATRGFFPTATGKIFLGRALAGQGTSAPAQSLADQVTISIAWTGGDQSNGSISVSTIIQGQ